MVLWSAAGNRKENNRRLEIGRGGESEILCEEIITRGL